LPIKELNCQEYSKNLAQQAMGYVPAEFSEEIKNYIAKKVYEFCVITGDYLLKQYKEQFTDEQAVVIIQFIGEWTFHKSVDVIRADIDPKYRDQILQQVAFAALKGALHAYTEKFEEIKIAEFIEYNVTKAYEESINQLVKANVIKQEKVKEILSHSNLEKMAKESTVQQVSAAEEDEKTLKYATIAMFLKKMPKEKAEKILAKMNEPERTQIMSCLQINDLEKKLDASVINNYIKDLKRNIASHSKPGVNDLVKSFKKLQSKYGEEEIIELTIFERAKIQNFLSDCLFNDNLKAIKIELSPYILKILYNYLKTKLVMQN